VAAKRRQPVWLDRVAVEAIHDEQVREHGGLPGLRDEHALESALARPQHKCGYASKTDIASLAAAYGFGLARSHPFRDGNTRIAFLAVFTFLGLNGFDLTATEEDVVTQFVALAAGNVSEDQLGQWILGHVEKAR
jgi:death on curing protein